MLLTHENTPTKPHNDPHNSHVQAPLFPSSSKIERREKIKVRDIWLDIRRIMTPKSGFLDVKTEPKGHLHGPEFYQDQESTSRRLWILSQKNSESTTQNPENPESSTLDSGLVGTREGDP